jgi:hypothetical protein
MPPRSKVFTLPPEVLAELDRRLIDSGFGGYRDLAGWLAEQGYQIQKSALQRYGSGLEADFERTMADVQKTQRLAQAYAEANPDEANAMTGATVRIAQESLLRITLALRQAEEDPAALARSMPNVTRALADLGRLDISREKWAREMQQAERSAAADRAEQAAVSKGISPDGISALRAAIMSQL